MLRVSGAARLSLFRLDRSLPPSNEHHPTLGLPPTMSFARSLSLLSSRLPSSFASSSRRAYSTPSPSEPPSPQKAGLTTERWQR